MADGDNIAIAYTIVGTQDGEFGGVALTGKEDSRAGFRSLDFGTMNGRAVGQRGTVGNLPANRHSGDIGPSPRRLYAIRPATELGGVRRVGVDARNAVRLTRQIRSLSFCLTRITPPPIAM